MYAVGQYSKPKKALEERLCTLYHLNAIESEVHFLIDCPLYDDSQFSMHIKVHIHGTDTIGT